MKNQLLFYFLLTSSILIAQDNIRYIKFEALNTKYKDFVIVENEIYAITEGDSLVTWNIKNNRSSIIKTNVQTIAKNSSRLYISTTNNKILLLNKSNKWKEFTSFKGDAFKMFIDNQNLPILITNKGVIHKNKLFYPDKPSRIYHSRNKNDTINLYLRKPDVSYLDIKNRIWLTYDGGEFSDDIWFFNIKESEFIEEQHLNINGHLTYKEEKKWIKKNDYKKAIIDTFPNQIKLKNNKLIYKFPAGIPVYHGIKGIVEDNNDKLYLSQSLMHFFLSGGISIYSETEFEDFYDSSYFKDFLDYEITVKVNPDGTKKQLKNLEEYLGPLSFNIYNNSIYYYSNKGFFKLIKNKDESFSKKLILKPKLIWKGGLPNSVGYQMAVKKFEFIDKKRFVFLTNLNGIGYYDGKNLKFYR